MTIPASSGERRLVAVRVVAEYEDGGREETLISRPRFMKVTGLRQYAAAVAASPDAEDAIVATGNYQTSFILYTVKEDELAGLQDMTGAHQEGRELGETWWVDWDPCASDEAAV